MKKILSLILLSLYICSAFSAETLTVSQEGSNKDPQSVLVYKCIGSVNLAAGDAVTHTFQFKKNTDSYAAVSSLTGAQVVEGPRTVGSVAYSYLLIKQGNFVANDAVTIQCTSTWTGTPANSQATAVASTAVTISGSAAANTGAMIPTLNTEKTSLTIAVAGQAASDKLQYILPNSAISALSSFVIDVSNANNGRIYIIYNVGGGTDGAQQLLSYDLTKISATDSAKKNNCEIMTPVFKVPKTTYFATATVTLELNDGSAVVANKADYYQTTDTTDVIVNVYIQSESLKSKSTAFLTIKIVQNSSAPAVLSTSYVKYAIPAVGSESYCTMSTTATLATATLAYTNTCTSQTITTSISGKISSLSGVAAIALTTDGTTLNLTTPLTEKTIILQTIKSTDTSAIESKYFVLDKLKPCLVVTKTAGTKACEEAKFTCERKTGPTTGAVTYDWSYAPLITVLTLTDTEATNVSTTSIAATKLTAGTKYTITCTSSLATVSESNGTSVDYTPTADSCTSSPAADDDDDDNSSILGVLVIALLALVF